MACPRCGFVYAGDLRECPRCGVVFAKIARARQDAGLLTGVISPIGRADVEPTDADRDALRRELRARVLALPGAILFAWIAVKTSPGLVRIFTMWVHESGHAASAWVCGYMAWPGPWMTPTGGERSVAFTVMLVGLLVYGAFVAWQHQRWCWGVVATAAVLLVLGCTLFLRPGQGRQMIVFGGDGGCLVLGTLLMLTVYAPQDHQLRSERLRWVLLVFGALALMDAYRVWSGPLDRLPFGEDERGLSDASVLVEEFGWSVLLLVNRYLALARICFLVLAAAYVGGLAQVALALRSRPGPGERRVTRAA